MCVVSMVIDDWYRKNPWQPETPWKLPEPVSNPYQDPTNIPNQQIIPQTKIDELIDLLKKAAEIDRKTGQPDCEKPELIEWLQKVLDRFDTFQRNIEEILKDKPKKKRISRKKKI